MGLSKWLYNAQRQPAHPNIAILKDEFLKNLSSYI